MKTGKFTSIIVLAVVIFTLISSIWALAVDSNCETDLNAAECKIDLNNSNNVFNNNPINNLNNNSTTTSFDYVNKE
ncbi:MAG: hypothetical protein V1824_02195 [archaeon]